MSWNHIPSRDTDTYFWHTLCLSNKYFSGDLFALLLMQSMSSRTGIWKVSNVSFCNVWYTDCERVYLTSTHTHPLHKSCILENGWPVHGLSVCSYERIGYRKQYIFPCLALWYVENLGVVHWYDCSVVVADRDSLRRLQQKICSLSGNN